MWNVARLSLSTRNFLFPKIRFAELGGKLDLSGSASHRKKAPEIKTRLVVCAPVMELFALQSACPCFQGMCNTQCVAVWAFGGGEGELSGPFLALGGGDPWA